MLSPTLVGDWEFEVSDTTLPHQLSESVSRGRHDHAHVDRFALERRPGEQVASTRGSLARGRRRTAQLRRRR